MFGHRLCLVTLLRGLPVQGGATVVRKVTALFFAWVWIASTGCAAFSEFGDPAGTKKALKNAQKRYTELVRWGELERASEYVDPNLRDEFLNYADAFAGIRFTDFESGELRIGEGDITATAIVVYHAYSLSTLLEKRIRESQQWYRDEETFNQWRVRPQLRQIIAGVTGRWPSR